MKRSETESAGESLEKRALELRVKGNNCFSKKDYDGAIRFYNESVDTCLIRLPDESYQLRSSHLLDSMIAAQSNKVEALLQSGYYSKAAHEAELVLMFDPDHVKTLSRKGRALQKRQLHELAHDCFQKALDLMPRSRELQEDIKKSKAFCEQKNDGTHDVTEFLLGEDSDELEPEIADYIGPVEVKMTSDGKGRGLFVTRDVEVGELLLVTNAAVYNVVGARYDLGSCLNQLKLAAEDSFNLVRRLSALRDKNDEKDISMEVFHPKEDPPPSLFEHLRGGGYSVNLAMLNQLYNDNGIRVSKPGKNLTEGLWILPSFINHSCRPNASQHLLGRVVFNFAATRIPAGGEILTCYFNSLVPWNPTRRDQSQAIGEFDCNCERCSLEKRLEKPLASLSKLFELYHKKNYSALSRAEQKRVRAGYGKVASMLEANVSSLSEREQQWIRGAYVDAYFHQDDVKVDVLQLARAVRDACPTDIEVLSKIYHYAKSMEMPDVPDVVKLVEEACVSIYGLSANKRMKDLVRYCLR